MKVLIEPAGRIKGKLTAPADKSISHRAAILAAMADEPVLITNYLEAADTLSTLAAIEQLGALVERRSEGLMIRGVGLRNAQTPAPSLRSSTEQSSGSRRLAQRSAAATLPG